VLREYRRLARLAAGEPVGTPKRDLLLDKTAVQLARLVFIERVLALAESDPLAHAALSAVDLGAAVGDLAGGDSSEAG
jgi:hypothetical protein